MDPSSYAGTAELLEDEHPVEPDAARTRWGGEHLDRRFAVDVLADRRYLSRRQRTADDARPREAFSTLGPAPQRRMDPDYNPWDKAG